MRSSNSLSPTPAVWSILVVCDHPLLRRGLNALIESEPDLSVCTEQPATQREGLQAIATARPDLAIVNLSHAFGDGLAMVSAFRLARKRLPLLILLDNVPGYGERAFEAGASDCLTKQEMSETLLIVIRRLLSSAK